MFAGFVTLIVSIPVCDPVLQGPGGMRLRLGVAEIPKEMEIPQQPNCQQHFTVILLRYVWGGRGDDQNHQYVQQDCSPDLSVCHGGSQKLGGEKTQPASHIHCGGAHGGMSTRLNTVLFAILDQSTCLWALLLATLMGVSKISINTVLRKYIGLQHIQRSGS